MTAHDDETSPLDLQSVIEAVQRDLGPDTDPGAIEDTLSALLHEPEFEHPRVTTFLAIFLRRRATDLLRARRAAQLH